MSRKERTVIILKPDAVQRGIMGEILHRFERRGLKIVGMKFAQLPKETIEEHYAHHSEKPFFPKLVGFMTSAPALAAVLEGKNVVKVVRDMCGPTHGGEAAPGTIRGDFSLTMGQNIVHASEDVAQAEAEVKRFFSEDELFSGYERADWQMVYPEEDRE